MSRFEEQNRQFLSTLIYGMKEYYKSYRERFPDKPYESAKSATRNWAEGYTKVFRPVLLNYEEMHNWIEKTLNKIVMENY